MSVCTSSLSLIVLTLTQPGALEGRLVGKYLSVHSIFLYLFLDYHQASALAGGDLYNVLAWSNWQSVCK